MRVTLFALTAALPACIAAGQTRAQEAPMPAREIASAREAAPARPYCMSPDQWRKETPGQKLLDPFQCMRETALRHQAEALGARLCRLGELLLYEIKLLTQNGHVQKVWVDAASGMPHSGRMEQIQGK